MSRKARLYEIQALNEKLNTLGDKHEDLIVDHLVCVQRIENCEHLHQQINSLRQEVNLLQAVIAQIKGEVIESTQENGIVAYQPPKDQSWGEYMSSWLPSFGGKESEESEEKPKPKTKRKTKDKKDQKYKTDDEFLKDDEK